MKLLLLMMLFITPAKAETQKVIVGNQNSRNNLQINQFYVISRPNNTNYTSQVIMTYPNNQQPNNLRQDNNTFNKNYDFYGN